MQRETRLTANVIYMLQLSMNVMERPSEAVNDPSEHSAGVEWHSVSVYSQQITTAIRATRFRSSSEAFWFGKPANLAVSRRARAGAHARPGQSVRADGAPGSAL